MFLKSCWYVAAFDHELTGDGLLSRRILGERVLLYRTSTGAVVAMRDQCPHRLVPLSAGRRAGDAIQCGYHGLVVGSDGVCLKIPGQPVIPAAARVAVYPAISRFGHVWIWMGDAQKADEALIPHVPWPSLKGWATASGYLHFAADYRLLTDNLLDLSHETYIHEGTIGNDASQAIADYPAAVSVRDHQVVSAHREMPAIDPPPWFTMILGTTDKIDRWQTAIWAPASINMTDTGAHRVGEPRSSAYVGRILHLLTPETETSTHYFWSVSRNYRADDAALTASIGAAVERTFEEDRHMLELQQRELLETGASVPRVALRVDEAPLRASRILAERIRGEAEGANGPLLPIVLTEQSHADCRAAER